MKAFATCTTIIGLLAYGFALANMETGLGEIASDIGNAAMLTSAVVLLFDIRKLLAAREPSGTAQLDDATDRAASDR